MLADQMTAPLTHHGEGAVWYAPWGGLKWVDMMAGAILSRDDATGSVTRSEIDSDVAALVRPRRSGGTVVVTERGFTLLAADGGVEWTSPDVLDEDSRFNEGAVDPLGRVLCGTIHSSRESGSAEMWRLNLDGSVTRLFGGVTISNGLAFTEDGTRAYYVDSRTRRIDVFDVAGGELTERRPFVALSDEVVGNPDGLCLDSEGGVWVALYNGGAVHRYGPHGMLDAVVSIPGVSRATSCTLGGSSGTTLFVTTSRENLAPGDEPAAGSIFAAEVGVRGVPIVPAAL